MAFFFLSFCGDKCLSSWGYKYCHSMAFFLFVILGVGCCLDHFSLSSWGLTPGSRYINLFASANSNLICVVYKIYGHYKFVRALHGILMTWTPWSSHGVTGWRWSSHRKTHQCPPPLFMGAGGVSCFARRGVGKSRVTSYELPVTPKRTTQRQWGFWGNVLKHY